MPCNGEFTTDSIVTDDELVLIPDFVRLRDRFDPCTSQYIEAVQDPGEGRAVVVVHWSTGGWSQNPRLARVPAFSRHYSAKGPVSRILSCAVIPLGAALPRTLISDLPGGSGVFQSRLGAPGRCAAPSWLLEWRFPPYLVLLRVGFTLPPVSRPERCALTAPFHPYPGTGATSRENSAGAPGWPFRAIPRT
jgi:hypothetical protein